VTVAFRLRPKRMHARPGLLRSYISQRYERGSTIITSNKAYKQWPEIFNNDSTLTAALLDRLLHHAETLVIEGSSYRMREQHDA
jgi:DNA replication protein DnaC